MQGLPGQITLYPNAAYSAPNIIVFGETGVGKSSLINMICGTECADVSSRALGSTFEATPYEVELEGRKYRLWDTAGLNEGEKGNVPADRAIECLQELVHNLRHGGVSLLVYCIRGLRFRNSVKINYDLFYKVICRRNVPIVIVVTGLEDEDNMEDWWLDNADDFYRSGIRIDGHACITTRRGKVTKTGQHMFEQEYNRSVKSVRELIVNSCLDKPWKPGNSRWLDNIAEMMGHMYAQSVNWARDYAGYLIQPFCDWFYKLFDQGSRYFHH